VAQSRPAPDFSNLPPAIAASLAKLAGRRGESAPEEEGAGAPGEGGKAPKGGAA
jgi:hypothetical protein